MSGHSLYRIGRSSSADIQINDRSVSRIHAELIITHNGSYYLTDCGGGGSFIARGGEWAPVQQQFIGATDNILLGRYQTTAQQLIAMLKDPQDNSAEQTPSPVDDLPSGPVRRNVEISLNFGDDQISRDQHSTVTYDPRGKKFYVQQGSGTNLTYLNDQPVLTPTELSATNDITLGNTVVRFVPFCGEDFDWQSTGNDES